MGRMGRDIWGKRGESDGHLPVALLGGRALHHRKVALAELLSDRVRSLDRRLLGEEAAARQGMN